MLPPRPLVSRGLMGTRHIVIMYICQYVRLKYYTRIYGKVSYYMFNINKMHSLDKHGIIEYKCFFFYVQTIKNTQIWRCPWYIQLGKNTMLYIVRY